MSNENWTEGPWEVDRFGAVKGGPEKQYINGTARDQVALAKAEVESERDANAHLIAAAPELYWALYQLLNCTRSCEALLNASEAGRCKYAEAALAKARGERQ